MLATPLQAAQPLPYGIRINGEYVQYFGDYQSPVVTEGSMLLPLRMVMEALGFDVVWRAQDQSAILNNQRYSVLIQVGNELMNIYFGVDIESDHYRALLDVPAQIINDRVMVPFQVITEATGMKVERDSENHIVDILSPTPTPVITPIPRPEHWPEYLPEYVPGSVTLDPHYASVFPNRQFRHAFYAVDGLFIDLVDNDDLDIFMDTYRADGVFEEMMFLMWFVQHFDIPRDIFDDTADKLRNIRQDQAARGVIEPNEERFEVPNADIIYTFDNEIIRYYYRRE
jgi:hypothetical protein